MPTYTLYSVFPSFLKLNPISFLKDVRNIKNWLKKIMSKHIYIKHLKISDIAVPDKEEFSWIPWIFTSKSGSLRLSYIINRCSNMTWTGYSSPLLPKQNTQDFSSHSVAVAHRLYMRNYHPHKNRIPGIKGYLFPSNLQGIHTKNPGVLHFILPWRKIIMGDSIIYSFI